MRILRIMLLAGLLPLFLGAQSPRLQQLDSYLETMAKADEPPALAVGVVEFGDVVHLKGFGYSDARRTSPVTAQSMFNLYSLTKIVTATAVMQLVEEGKVDLDQNVAHYLPWFKPTYEGEAVDVNVLQLLNHSAGLRDRFGMSGWVHFEDTLDDQTELAKEKVAEWLELSYRPGETAKYESFGYILLGAIIEKVTGLSYAEYVRYAIFDPLHLKYSGFVYTPTLEPYEVYGTMREWSFLGILARVFGEPERFVTEHRDGNMWMRRFYTDQLPPSGMLGSARDMALFLQAFLDGRLLKQKYLLEMMEEGRVVVKRYFSHFDHIEHGIGWYYLENDGIGFYQHQGIGLGFRNIMRIYPDRQIAFVLLTNQTETDVDSVADDIYSILSEGNS